MPRLRKYVLVALVLQLVQVIAGHYSGVVSDLSGLLGMGIPLVAGWLYSVRRGLSTKQAATGGLLIGAVGAFAGLILAAVLGEADWILISLGTVASAATGMIGSLLGSLLKTRAGQPQAES
jgi:uncharacterized membrane protein YfcA